MTNSTAAYCAAITDLAVADVARDGRHGTSTTAGSRTSRPTAYAPGLAAARRGRRCPTTRTTRRTCGSFEEAPAGPVRRAGAAPPQPADHLSNLDLACYDRDYAPERRAGRAPRRAHLARWPEAVEHAIAALDRLSAPVATALLGAVAGLAAGMPADAGETGARRAERPTRAWSRTSSDGARADGDPDAALGAAALARLMGAGEGLDVDLGRLAERADAERDRLLARLADGLRQARRAGPAAAGRGPRAGQAAPRRRRRDRGGQARHRARRSRSPARRTWCPTTTASAWSASRRSRAGGRWR